MRFAFLLGLCLAAAAAAPRAALERQIERLIASSPALAQAFAGIEVVSLSNGRILYRRNADRLFVPASNTKLFTTALALLRLGPDYRFRTSVRSEHAIDGEGVVAGDVTLVGGGDPSLSGRPYPYRKPASADDSTQALANDAFAALDAMADQMAAAGLKRVNGNIVGDDTRFVWEPQPGAWSGADALWEYGAPVSALIVNDNSLALTVGPGLAPGDAARIAIAPPFEIFAVENRVRTVEGALPKISVERGAGGGQVRVWGAIPPGDAGVTERLAVGDPALFAARALRDALMRRGVTVAGIAAARHRFRDEVADPERAARAAGLPGIELASRTSPPLWQLAQTLDKVSQNLHAEAMLREVGAARRGIGSREAGLAEMREFLDSAGIGADEYHFDDGSGLSRTNLATPAAVAKLLVYMYRSPMRDLWLSLLPVGGVDGTLSARFAGHPEAQKIQAKTGGLGHVRALSGYAQSRAHGPLAFSILVNNFDAPPAAITRILDEIGLKLLK